MSKIIKRTHADNVIAAQSKKIHQLHTILDVVESKLNNLVKYSDFGDHGGNVPSTIREILVEIHNRQLP